MNFIFYGFLLSFFGGFELGGVNIGPLFSIGAYFLIYKGVLSLDRENPNFKKVPTLLFVLMGLSGLSFVFALVDRNGIGGLLSIVAFIIDIIVIYNVIKGIQSYTDVLIDKKQPVKLFKRWRMQYILGAIALVLSFVMVIAAIASVSWAVIYEFAMDIQSAPLLDQAALEALINSYTTILAPAILIGVLWAFAAFVLIIWILVVKILFLVSMYRIQADYQVFLSTPAPVETPTNIQ